jgi:hypothetical protein
MMTVPKHLVLGGVSACALLAATTHAQGVCTASDMTHVQTSDCSWTDWTLGARWSDGAGHEDSNSNLGTESGNSLCVTDHIACDGRQVNFRLYPATESFTWETDPNDQEYVDFYWSIGNQSDTINECSPTEYDETVYVGYYSLSSWYYEWCN